MYLQNRIVINTTGKYINKKLLMKNRKSQFKFPTKKVKLKHHENHFLDFKSNIIENRITL